MRARRRLCRFVAAGVAVLLGTLGVPIVPAQASPPPDPDVTVIRAALTQFSDLSEALAATGRFGEPVPFLTLVPGGPAAAGFDTLFHKAILDRLATQAPTTFGDFGNLDGTFPLAGGRTVIVDATATPSAGSSTVERLDLDLKVSRDVDSGLAIASTSPSLNIASAGGVATHVDAHFKVSFSFDTATNDFWLMSSGPAAPVLSIDVDATIPAANLPSVRPAFGILETTLAAGSTLHVIEHLTGTFQDSDGNGRLAFLEPSASGPVPGQLVTAASIADLVSTSIAAGSTATASLHFISAPPATVIPGLNVPVDAAVTINDDMSDAIPASITATGFDTTLAKFQTLNNRDLLGGLRRLSGLVQAAVAQQLSGPDHGDVDLPFLKGRLSDVLGVDAALNAFIAAHGHVGGDPLPDFASIQQFFDELSSASAAGATIAVQQPTYDDATSKLSFTLVVTRANTGPEALDPQGQAAIGTVRLGDNLRTATGIAGANADAPAGATVARSYVVTLPIVLDLRLPLTGIACKGADPVRDPAPGVACPFAYQDPNSKTNTIIQSLPVTADRFLVHTGGELVHADADVDSPLPATGIGGRAGFVTVQLGGAGSVVQLRTAPGHPHLVTISLTAPASGSPDRTIDAIFAGLHTAPTGVLTSSTFGRGSASFTASVPGAPSFFTGATGAGMAVFADITDASTVTVTAPDVASRLKPLDFGGTADPAALRQKVSSALDAVRSTLGSLSTLSTGGPANDDLTKPIQVLGHPFASYVGSGELKAALDNVVAQAPDSLQDLLGRLSTAHVQSAAPTFDIDTSTSPASLVVHLQYHRSGTTAPAPLGLAYDAGSGVKHVVGSGPSGDLAPSVSSDANFDVVVPLDGNVAVGPSDVKVRQSSSLAVAPALTSSGQTYSALAGALPLTFTGASIDAHPSLTVAGAGANAVSLQSWAQTATATLGGTNGSCGQVLCADLPTDPSTGFTVALAAPNVFDAVTGGAVPTGIVLQQQQTPMPLGQLSTGTGGMFEDLAKALDQASLEGKLPFVGSDLQEGSQFLTDLDTHLSASLDGLGTSDAAHYASAHDVESTLDSAIEGVTGPNSADTHVFCGAGAAPCLPTNGATDVSRVSVAFNVGKGNPSSAGCTTDCIGSDGRPFSIGVPGIQLRNLPSPHTALGWSLHIAFVFDKADGFYLDTSQPDELKVGLAVSLPISDSSPIQGDLAFLHMTVTQNGSTAAGFHGLFSVDLHAPDDKLTIDSLASSDLSELVTLRLDGNVGINWHLAASVGSALPGVGADFFLSWGFSTDPNSAAADDGLVIAFKNVTLDISQLIPGALQPVFENIKKVVAPLKPVLDAIEAPLPGLSDVSHLVGGGDISVLTLMKLYSTYGDGNFAGLVRLITLLKQIVKFTDLASSHLIPIGDFDVDGTKALGELPSPDHLTDLLKNQAFNTLESIRQAITDKCGDPCNQVLSVLDEQFGAPSDGGGFTLPVIENPQSLAGVLLGKDVDLATFDSGTLHQGFGFSETFGPIIPFPPIVVDVTLKGDVYARVRAGFDTKGIREAFGGGGAASILNGLYLKDFDDQGKDVDEISVKGVASLGLGVGVPGVSAGIEGGIDLNAYLNLHDTDSPQQPDVANTGAGDGKVRFGELGADPQGRFNAACIFDSSGKIAASVDLYAKIGFGPISKKFTQNLGDSTLVDLSHNCSVPKTEPVLGKVVGDTLYVNVGRLNTARGAGWTSNDLKPPDGPYDESTVVRALHGPDGGFLGFGIDLINHHKDFLLADNPGLNRVVIDGRNYAGHETVSLLGDGSGAKAGDTPITYRFDRPALVLGGDNVDTIKAQTTAFAAVDGGPGNDSIVTGDGNDLVAGGGGDDTLTSGLGDDIVHGDGALGIPTAVTVEGVSVASANGVTLDNTTIENPTTDGVDTADGGQGRDQIFGDGASDTLSAGDQSPLPGTTDPGNVVVGGSGDDFIRGGPGNDDLYGDEDQQLGEDAAGAVTGGKDTIDTGLGTDRVWGGNGDDLVTGRSDAATPTVDTLYGNGGVDTLTAGSGNDFVYGGPGADVLKGGFGNDLVKGGDDDDTIGGDGAFAPLRFHGSSAPQLNDTPSDGNDTLYGGHGGDNVYGGGGDDIVYGDSGRADCNGPSVGQPEWTPTAEPVDAADGVDVLTGGNGDDKLSGEGGNDDVQGSAGNDLLCGGAQDDTIRGGSGVDRGWGGSGSDFLYGDGDADRLYGNTESDTLFGGDGNDHLEGNAGADTAYGESADDRVIGGSTTAATSDDGDTLLAGGPGNDVIVGDNGTITDDAVPVVTVFDMSGAYDSAFGKGDAIDGGSEADRAYGALGDDSIHGGTGDDHLEGNVGNDTIYGDENQDDIIGGTSPDALAGNTTAAANVFDGGETLLSGGDERDVITGDNAIITRPGGVDPVTGGVKRVLTLLDRERTGSALALVSGGDYVEGNGERDRIYGQGGDDYLKGNDSDDYVEGNQGNDRLEGNDGDDDLIGGSSFITTPGVGDPDGNDAIAGGAGADVVAGDNAIVTRDASNPGGPYDWDTASNGWIGPVATHYLKFLDVAALKAGNYGTDTLSGGAGADVLFGQDGVDTIYGGGNDDYLEGNGGADVLFGDQSAAPTGLAHESAQPQLDGPAAPDGQDDEIGGSSLVRSSSAGVITGQRDEADVIHGDGNADVQLGDNGRVVRRIVSGQYLTYFPQTQRPTVVRQAALTGQTPTALPARFDVGAATSSGLFGNDTLYGDAGDDVQFGQDGNDTMYGGANDDDMYGELGNDRMFGEAGEDAMLGDRGLITDALVTKPGTKMQISSIPRLAFTPFAAHPYDRRVDMKDDGDGAPLQALGLTAGGDDFMRGGDDHDSLHGEAGNDLMNGDTGGDYLFGDDGVDVMWGGQGRACANPNDLACNTDRGTNDANLDYLFGGHGLKSDPVTGGADILDFRPRPGIDPQTWFDATSSNPSDPVATHQHHQGIDWIYGGWDRDVMQADVADNGPNDGDRLLDWVGAFNLYTHCNAAYGGYNDVRQHSPAMQDFLQKLAYSLGAGKSVTEVQASGTSGYDELALVYTKDIGGNNSGAAYPTTPGHFDQFSCAP